MCRNNLAYPLAELKQEVERELDHLCSLSFRPEEVAYVRGRRFIKGDFADFLTLFRFQRHFVTANTDGDTLTIRAPGPQVHMMGFEIFVLYIANELYFRCFDQAAALAEGRKRLAAKIGLINTMGEQEQRRHPFEFFDFGVRRRFSGAWHEGVVAILVRTAPAYSKSTSNAWFALKYQLAPIGTMAPEYLQSFQSFGCACAISRRPRWQTGCKSTAATSARR